MGREAAVPPYSTPRGTLATSMLHPYPGNTTGRFLNGLQCLQQWPQKCLANSQTWMQRRQQTMLMSGWREGLQFWPSKRSVRLPRGVK